MPSSKDVPSEPSALPAPAQLHQRMLWVSLYNGWCDFKRAPLFGLSFSAVYVLGGLVMLAIVAASAAEMWFIPIAVGFPILAPFAATGLYEVSRRIEQDLPLDLSDILSVVFAQKDRQIPSMAMAIMLGFMFWVFIAHTTFAVFFGLQPVGLSAWDMLATPSGVMMLLVGSLIGGIMAAIFFALTVVSLPLLLDKEVDYITSMITSVQVCLRNPMVMAIWAGTIALALFLAMLPLFLGLFVVLPVFGHATWHLYRWALPEDRG